ncbi:MAG: biopolymer transporter ExbD [Planctomycetota bacterium]
MRLDLGNTQEGALNLTPLIDMVFLLLVFFLASTTFAKDEVEMDLTLPEASSGKAETDGHLLVINVKRDGSLTVNRRTVTLEGLRQRLRAAAAKDRDQEVLIRGDTKVDFGVVAKAFDACLAATLRRVSIAARPLEGGTPR